jgi:hypothetical protein
MLLIQRRPFFAALLCKGAFITKLSLGSLVFAEASNTKHTFVCTTKGNIKNPINSPWYAFKTKQTVNEHPVISYLATSLPNKDLGNKSDISSVVLQPEFSGLFHWGTSVLGLVQKYQQNPLRASRILSYVHVGMHDAWLQTQIALEKEINSTPQCAIACHRAASLLLSHFYPNEARERFEAEFIYLTASLTLTDQDRSLVIKTGTEVAVQLIQRSWQDGAARHWDLKQRPAAFPGIWSPAYPLYAVNPTEGMAAQWLPWVTPKTDRYIPPKAALPSSINYESEIQHVIEVSKHLTASQAEAAKRWNLEAGSATPAGVWFQLAKVALRKNLSQCQIDNREALALCVLTDLTVAMHDAFIACWVVKFRDWSERPITAIRRTVDPQFTPLLVTPSFPSYVSGHATISAAAAVVLSHHFPNDQQHYRHLAEEAANSRLWGGIHFDIDNKEGLLLGASVGLEVLLSKQKS